MKAKAMSALATEFKDTVAAARHAQQTQSLANLAESLEDALKGWTDVAAVAATFRELKIDWSGYRTEVEALRQLPLETTQGLILASVQELAAKPASTFRGKEAKNLKMIADGFALRWTVWTEEQLSALGWIDPLAGKSAQFSSLKSKIDRLKRERPVAPPTAEAEREKARKWIETRNMLLNEIDKLVEPAVARFLKQALTGSEWLDALSPGVLAWINAQGLAGYFKVSFSQTPNPKPSTSTVPEPPGPKDGADDDWT